MSVLRTKKKKDLFLNIAVSSHLGLDSYQVPIYWLIFWTRLPRHMSFVESKTSGQKALYGTNKDKWKTTFLCSSCLVATGFPVDVFDYRKHHMITQMESCLAYSWD